MRGCPLAPNAGSAIFLGQARDGGELMGSESESGNGSSFKPISGILSRLVGLRPQLGPTGRRIADYILDHPEQVIHMSVTELAQQTRASDGSVIALCKQVGATGFQQIKIVLAQELVQPVQFIHEDLEPTDRAGTVIEKIFGSGIQALRDTTEVLDPAAVDRAVRALANARRIDLFGIGSAAPIVEDAYYRMLRLGLDCRVLIDSHIQTVSAVQTDPSITTLTVTHSGSTYETVAATRLAREAGATTVCITNYGKSPIHAYSDIVLHTMARETQFRTEAMTSRIAQLAVIDVLIAALALRDYESSVETIRRTAEALSIKRY